MNARAADDDGHDRNQGNEADSNDQRPKARDR